MVLVSYLFYLTQRYWFLAYNCHIKVRLKSADRTKRLTSESRALSEEYSLTLEVIKAFFASNQFINAKRVCI